MTPGSRAVHHLVQLLEERDRVQVLAAAVLVGHPLARLARVVEVEHRGDGVDPQPVGVVLAQPEERVREQEVPHLAAPVVEHQRPPVRVRAAPWVGVLVERGAVEAGERPLVAREVAGHPVEQDAEPALVQAVDERAEVVGRAEPRGGRVEPGHLVAPRARERVLHHRQQLHVGEAEVGGVVGELVRQLEVRQRAVALQRVAPPGAEVHLVDRHRHRVELLGRVAAALEPRLVGPLVGGLEDDGRVGRRHLGRLRVRVGLEDDRAVGAPDGELVALAGRHLGHEELPDPGAPERPHRVEARSQRLKSPTTLTPCAFGAQSAKAVPVTPSTSRTCAPSRSQSSSWRPSPARCRSSSPSVGANAYGSWTVMVLPSGVAHLELVAERQPGVVDDALEQPRLAGRLELDRVVALRPGDDRDRVGAERADDHAAARRVRPERRVRVVQLDGHSSSSRRIPATGIPSQSGRWLSS